MGIAVNRSMEVSVLNVSVMANDKLPMTSTILYESLISFLVKCDNWTGKSGGRVCVWTGRKKKKDF